MAEEEKKLEVFPIGITAKEIVKVVEEAGISGGATEITADNIDSGAATNGQVLTADGSGGASWANVSGGGSGGDSPILEFDFQDVPSIQDIVDELTESEYRNRIFICNYKRYGQQQTAMGVLSYYENPAYMGGGTTFEIKLYFVSSYGSMVFTSQSYNSTQATYSEISLNDVVNGSMAGYPLPFPSSDKTIAITYRVDSTGVLESTTASYDLVDGTYTLKITITDGVPQLQLVADNA